MPNPPVSLLLVLLRLFPKAPGPAPAPTSVGLLPGFRPTFTWLLPSLYLASARFLPGRFRRVKIVKFRSSSASNPEKNQKKMPAPSSTGSPSSAHPCRRSLLLSCPPPGHSFPYAAGSPFVFPAGQRPGEHPSVGPEGEKGGERGRATAANDGKRGAFCVPGGTKA